MIVIIILILSFLIFPNCKRYIFFNRESGFVTFCIPKITENISIDGIHLLMKKSNIEGLNPDIIDKMDSKNGWETFIKDNYRIKGNYSNLYRGTYVNEEGLVVKNNIVNMITITDRQDEIFGVMINQEIYEAGKILISHGFKFTKGRAQNNPNFIYYMIFNKGDLYILLNNNQGILKMLEYSGDTNFDVNQLNKVRQITIEIKTGIDEPFISEDYDRALYLDMFEKSYLIDVNEIFKNNNIE